MYKLVVLIAVIISFVFAGSGFSSSQPITILKNRDNTQRAIPITIKMPRVANSDLVILSQNFDSTWSTISPPPGWSIGYTGTVGTSDWGRHNYIWGVGSGNASIYYSPGEIGPDSLISPVINLTGMINVVLNCTCNFQHYNGPYTALILGSIDGGATYPYRIYDFAQTTQIIGFHTTLPWADNQANVRILFLGDGNTWNIDWFCVDEFSVTAQPRVENDVSLLRIQEPKGLIPAGSYNPQAWVKNFGLNAVGPFGVRCYITPTGYSDVQQVASLNPGDSTLVTFSSWSTNPGSYAIKCTTQLEGDDYTENDFLVDLVVVFDFVHDFETNDANFFPNPFSGGWEWGIATVGPPNAHSGTQLWGTILNDGYPNSANFRLNSYLYWASVNNPTLYYYDWWRTEAGWDGYNVSYSTDNGQTWIIIDPAGGYNYPNVSGLGQRGFSGEQITWGLKTFTLPVPANTEFLIRWRFGSDASVTSAGVYIDDVTGRGFVPISVINDIGVRAVTNPLDSIQIHSAIQPRGLVKNYGLETQIDISVTCWIDSFGVRIYDSSISIPSIATGDTSTATFSLWTVGSSPQYQITMFTTLSTDSLLFNDTVRKTINTFLWGQISLPLNTPDRLTHGAVYDSGGDKIYMFGGSHNGQSGSNLNLCQEYDPVTNNWSDKTSMPIAKGWIQGSIVKGKIYVIGGFTNASTVLNENIEYDLVSDTWLVKAPSPQLRCAHMEAVWRDSLIYVMGGFNGSIALSNVDIYNPFTDTWTAGTPLLEPGEMGDAIIIGDTIYIIGTPYHPSNIWSNLLKGAINPSNPIQITWIVGPRLPFSPAAPAMAAFDNKVYVLDSNQIWFYAQGFDTIFHFTQYPVTVNKTQVVIRTASLAKELYFIAGDSGTNWASPNRVYKKYILCDEFDVYDIMERNSTLTITPCEVKPNPAANEVKIFYSVSKSDKFELTIFNTLGRIVKKFSKEQEAGNHVYVWNRQDQNGKKAPNGVYFVRLKVDNILHNKKIVLTK